jgi:sugar phosphate isomerase/epimerase
MTRFPVGIIADAFRLPIRRGIDRAAELGVDGVQIWAVDGEMAPENIDGPGRESLRAYCRDRGLTIAALCGDLGGHGFQNAEEARTKIPRSKRIVDLAVDLGTRVVTTHIGVVPDDRDDPVYNQMVDTCRDIGRYAAERGVAFAIETGPEPSARLSEFLDDVDTPGMAVNFDPANLVMVHGEDPAEGVRILGPRIVHTHAKDGVRYRPCDPVAIYDAFAVGGVEGLRFGDFFDELPLGEGQVDWDAYLRALDEVGYRGFQTIEREVGDDPARDIGIAVAFLRDRLGPLPDGPVSAP